MGTDLAHGAVFKTVGAILHRRLGNVKARLVGWMFVGSAAMSLVGLWLASASGTAAAWTRSWGRVLGVSLLISAFGLFAKAFVRLGEDW